jgi:predicted ArsR family transcriptional regulator
MMTNVMTKSFSRQKMLAYLGAHPGATAGEMARAFHVTPANVRHHLSVLVADGRVQVLGHRQLEGRGRPVRFYGVNDTPDLSLLAEALLAEWLENVPANEQEMALRALAGRLAATQPGERTGPALRRLSLTIERLNHLGYRSRWEAHAAGPRVILGRCPYAMMIDRHPELCKMDRFLLEKWLAQPMEQLAKLESSERGLPFCLFALR